MSPPTMKFTITVVFLTLLRLCFQLSSSQSQSQLFGCDLPLDTFPFCNPSLSAAERSRDLVSRLELDEKIAQLTDSAPPIPRLGIPGYEWWSESLHGVSRHGRGFRFNATFDANGTAHDRDHHDVPIPSATMFPQTILTAASFDPTLFYRIARAISTEARAMFNAGQGKGMTFWAPNINIFRDPRWGRGQETPGEDPHLTSSYGLYYVRGLQGYTLDGHNMMFFNYLQASACCKHYAAYDLDNWHGITRYLFDAKVSKQDMADTFQPPFQTCVKDARGTSIMCAYNRINGVPTCANRHLLTDTARQDWHFDGYITSDCGAVSIIHNSQGYAKTPEDAVADVLNAGMDVECGTYTIQHAKSAMQQKKIKVNVVDQALLNLFSVRIRLGLFDRELSNRAFGEIGPNQVCSKDHQDLALDAAKNGIVLLKNLENLLPLAKLSTKSLGVIGPNADSPQMLLANYEGFPCKITTPLQGLQSYVKNTSFHRACDSVECLSTPDGELKKIAAEVDHVVLVMGLDQTQEREKKDRQDLVLPGNQESVITKVANAAKNPVVLVILSGGPVDVSFAKDHHKIGSIVWAGYPGEAGGTAISQVIFGDHNPGGRLPVTWYPQEFTQIPMTDMRMRPNKSSAYPGRTYRFYQGKKVFEFGFGLSFSNYTYKIISVDQENIHLGQFYRDNRSSNSGSYALVSELESIDLCSKMKILVKVEVANSGNMGGGHPVLLFVRPSRQGEGRPLKQLVGFQRVELNGKSKTEIEYTLYPCKCLSWANEDGLMVIEEGAYMLGVGEAEHQIIVEY